jgi:hypothetical protein
MCCHVWNRSCRCSTPWSSPRIAVLPTGDEHARDVPTPVEPLPNERLIDCCVAAVLHQIIEPSPVLIHRLPRVIPWPLIVRQTSSRCHVSLGWEHRRRRSSAYG